MSKLRIAMAVGLVALLLAGCSAPAPTTTPAPKTTAPPVTTAPPATTPAAKVPTPIAGVKMPQFIRVLGGATPGVLSDIMARWVLDGLKKSLPEVAGSQVPGSAIDGPMLVQKGEVDLGWFSASSPYDAWKGQKQYKDLGPSTNLRWLWNMPELSQMGPWVLKDSPVKTPADLKNKKMGVGTTGASTQTVMQTSFKLAYGFDYEGIKAAGGMVSYGDWTNQFELLAGDRLDAVCIGTQHPFGPLTILDVQRGIRPLEFPAEARQNIIKEIPGLYESAIPAGAYKSVTSRVIQFGNVAGFLVSKNLSEEQVYNLLCAVFTDEQVAKIKAANAAWATMDFIGSALNSALIPIHPGAVKYWSQRGLKIPKTLLE